MSPTPAPRDAGPDAAPGPAGPATPDPAAADPAVREPDTLRGSPAAGPTLVPVVLRAGDQPPTRTAKITRGPRMVRPLHPAGHVGVDLTRALRHPAGTVDVVATTAQMLSSPVASAVADLHCSVSRQVLQATRVVDSMRPAVSVAVDLHRSMSRQVLQANRVVEDMQRWIPKLITPDLLWPKLWLSPDLSLWPAGSITANLLRPLDVIRPQLLDLAQVVTDALDAARWSIRQLEQTWEVFQQAGRRVAFWSVRRARNALERGDLEAVGEFVQDWLGLYPTPARVDAAVEALLVFDLAGYAPDAGHVALEDLRALVNARHRPDSLVLGTRLRGPLHRLAGRRRPAGNRRPAWSRTVDRGRGARPAAARRRPPTHRADQAAAPGPPGHRDGQVRDRLFLGKGRDQLRAGRLAR